jgi:hypothetical protein
MSSPRVGEEKFGIANNPEYCGKVLEIDKGKRCSLHFHKLKLESFYLRRGKLKLRVKESPEAPQSRSSNSMLESVSMSLEVWCIKWKQSRTASYMRSRLSIF